MVDRHSLHVGLAAIAIGLPLAGHFDRTVLVAAGAGTALAWARVTWLACVAPILVVCASVVGAERLAAIDRTELRGMLGEHVEARGYLVRRERTTHGTRRMRVHLTRIGGRRVGEQVQLRVAARVAMPSASIGDELKLSGELRDLPGSREGDFDYRDYLWRAGVHAVFRGDGVRLTGATRTGVKGMVDLIRRRAEAGVGAGLNPPLRTLALGMVLGQDEQIREPVRDDFKDSGLAHVLAVSGQNVTLLALLAWALLGLARVERRLRLIVVLALIALYVPVTGAGASILRAGVMGAAGTVAALSGRPASRWYALLLAALVTLALDPRAWLDAGWQLSFAAVGGIFLLMGPLTSAMRHLPALLREGIAMTTAATVATVPLMAFHFGRVSVVTLLANVVALPAIAPVMWAGMISSLLAQVSSAAALPVNALSSYCLAYVAAVAHWSAGLPGAVADVKAGSIWWLMLAYAVLGVIAFALVRGRDRGASRVRWMALAAAVAAAAGTGVLVAGVKHPPSTNGRFSATFIDVGQGDAILLRTPRGASVLVDGGVPEADVASKLDGLGVKRLDMVVLTHPEDDHQGGLLEVLQRMSVRMLLDGGRGAPDAQHRKIVRTARGLGVDVTSVRGGATFTLDGLRLRVLSPQRPYQPGLTATSNDQAIVLLASYRGFDMLLTADAESNVTGALQIPRIELLKVAHHGSADDGLAQQIEVTAPEIAVVEVGADNNYGHPTPSTLASLRSVPEVYRTDRDGDVTVILGPRGPEVDTSR